MDLEAAMGGAMQEAEPEGSAPDANASEQEEYTHDETGRLADSAMSASDKNIMRQFEGSKLSKAQEAQNATLDALFAMDANGREEVTESEVEIYIANAGLVLISPYLPQLFRMLDLTLESKFKDERAAERAIHLLQFAANESCDSPEFLLPLNKLLCGVATGVPIVRGIEPLPKEKEAIEGMLSAIIRNWAIIGNTSVQGLRQSFLQRGGLLQLQGENWRLKVEQKGMDVLLDRLPWSFSIIKYPWMPRPIHVEWR